MGSVVSLHAHHLRVEADRLASVAPLIMPFGVGALGAQARLLTLLGSDSSLPVLLDALARYVETWAPAMWCSILIRDARRNVLLPGAAPSLPRAYVEALGEIPIAENVGSCGTAAARGQTVTVPDLHESALWADFRSLIEPHGLRACWSVPFLDDAGEVLGTLALYYRTPREPTDDERALITFAAALAKMVVLQHRRLAALWASNARGALERAVIESAEREREHLALDLHDGVCQQLIGIEWLLAAEAVSAGPARSDALTELQKLVAAVQRDVGTLATWMLPLTRHRNGLAGALADLAHHTAVEHRIECRAAVHLPDGLALGDETGNQLLRIVQGAVSHALEQGGCSAIDIGLGATTAQLRLEVVVDGAALAGGEPAALRAARYRALQIGAQIVFEARGTGGSRMRVALPLRSA